MGRKAIHPDANTRNRAYRKRKRETIERAHDLLSRTAQGMPRILEVLKDSGRITPEGIEMLEQHIESCKEAAALISPR